MAEIYLGEFLILNSLFKLLSLRFELKNLNWAGYFLQMSLPESFDECTLYTGLSILVLLSKEQVCLR